MYLELVVDDDAACRCGVELLDDGQMCGMLHVLLKTGSVLEPGEEGVSISSGAAREVLTHGEVHGARDFFAQAVDRRDEIRDLLLRGFFPNGEEHEMVHHISPLGPEHTVGSLAGRPQEDAARLIYLIETSFLIPRCVTGEILIPYA